VNIKLVRILFSTGRVIFIFGSPAAYSRINNVMTILRLLGLPGGSLQKTGHWHYTGSASVCGTKYSALGTCVVWYYYHFYTGQRAKIPDSPVKYLATVTVTIHWCSSDRQVNNIIAIESNAIERCYLPATY